MSLSEDEDDFQSADEGGFGDDETQTDNIATTTTSKTLSLDLNEPDQVKSQEQSVSSKPEASTDKGDAIKTSSDDAKKIEEQTTSVPTDQEDDDEEAMVERIRERNLKIARKYSAEIAKSVKSSSPIPVQSGPIVGFKDDDIDYPTITDPEVKSSPPPAPPPTPALISSFNSEDTFSSQPSPSGTQYGWRISPKVRENQLESPQADNSKSEQARVALDRLAETSPQSDKSLFEKIAEDVKRVTITTGDRGESESSGSLDNSKSGSSTIPFLSEVGLSFGGWNWNSASKLLASASQVTSQVGSVLDSVVNIAPNLQPREFQISNNQKTESSTTKGNDNSETQNSLSNKNHKAAMSATEASSNDALVDFTLNAMESLGKRAFSVMTERDESGSLQIKGLGRPWEHLLNKKKEEQISTDIAADQLDETIETLNNESKSSSSICYDNIKKIDEEIPTTLKNRRRRLNYSNDDKLD